MKEPPSLERERERVHTKLSRFIFSFAGKILLINYPLINPT
jgi:hypothetical protein